MRAPDPAMMPLFLAGSAAIVALSLALVALRLAARLRRLRAAISDAARDAGVQPDAGTRGRDHESAHESADDSDQALRALLRLAQWRGARLATVAASVGRICHDVRGHLAPALLVAERLEGHADPAIMRAGVAVSQGVERTIALVRALGDEVRDDVQALRRDRCPLAATIAAAIAARPAAVRGPRIDADVGSQIVVDADPARLGVAFALLFVRAAEAGARAVRVTARLDPLGAVIEVADDGRVSAHADRGAAELTIVREILRAHAGDATQVSDATAGTVVRLVLPATPRQPG